MSGDEFFYYPRHGIGEQGPSSEDIEIGQLRDEVAKLKVQVEKEFNACQRAIGSADRLRNQGVVWASEQAAIIADGFAKEAAGSSERQVAQMIAAAIRARGAK